MNKKLKRVWRNIRFWLSRNLFTVFSIFKYPKVSWQTLNRSAITSFDQHRPSLQPIQSSLVDALNTNGIAVTDLQTLFPNEAILPDLLAYLEKRTARVYQNIKKPFLEDLIAEIPELGTEIPFFELATRSEILNVVNTYLGMHSRLTYFTVRRTILANGALPSHSQNWHRAPQEQKNCSVYIYLSDVTEDSGPFVYVPKSVKREAYSHIAPQTPFSRGYTSAEAVESKIPKHDQQVVTGKAGTVIFCDTTGLHRGGYSLSNTRTMSTFGYTAPSFRENIHYSYTADLQAILANRSPAAVDLLNPKWQR